MDLETIQKTWVLTPGNVDAETEAWDSEAEAYLFEEKNNFEDDPFLRFIAEKTELTREMRTLDVGCGAGAYSVAMAQRVGQADGVDLSPRMVELGNAWARDHAITNLRLWV
ncbi:MAG: class I SAM-dependent methyltransferase, partial [Oscillospiraceae bacterium]|nr:class I SAM-dependent methyltransferase [Oscillospiraceae bacterium]